MLLEDDEKEDGEDEWDYEHQMIPAKNTDHDKCEDDHCSWKAVPGTSKCKMHGGVAVLHKNNAQNIRNYRLAQWNNRVNEFAESPAIKSLRDEVGIARLTLEAILIKCTTPTQLILNSNKIADLLTRIEKLVSSCNRLEDKLGYTIDKTAIISFSTQIVEVISLHVDATTLEKITQKIADVIMDPATIKVNS